MKSNRPRIERLLAHGYTVLEIAHKLKISPQAVYKHKKAIEAESTEPGNLSSTEVPA